MTRTVISFQDRGHGMTTERRAMTFFYARLPILWRIRYWFATSHSVTQVVPSVGTIWFVTLWQPDGATETWPFYPRIPRASPVL